MRCVLLALLLLTSCRQPDRVAEPTPSVSASACLQRLFERTRFLVCTPSGGRIEIRTAASNGVPFRSFSVLEAALGQRAEQLLFVVNGGMFDKEGRAIGLSIEDGRELHPINLRKGHGNFHMKPNGVFLVRRDGHADVVPSRAYVADPDIMFATQSGPMLVVDGAIHPKFEADGPSRYVRNGVGIDAHGAAVFAISLADVSFGKFARLFRDELGAKNALYLDGSVSALWDPVDGRRDRHAPLGPMILVFKPEASAPHPEARATP